MLARRRAMPNGAASTQPRARRAYLVRRRARCVAAARRDVAHRSRRGRVRSIVCEEDGQVEDDVRGRRVHQLRHAGRDEALKPHGWS